MKQNDQRNNEMSVLYSTGKYTFGDIATMFGITRQRVEQIVFKGLTREIVKIKKKTDLIERNNNIVLLAKQGKNATEIANSFNMGIANVNTILRTHNIKILRIARKHKTKTTLEQKQLIQKLHATGEYSYYQLARIFNVSHTAIAYTVKKYKVE